jgi:hypothetical protein
LGWLLDTEKMTLQLTPRRIERLRELLYDEYPRSKKRTSITEWHKTLGELRSMTLALPGAKGLFSLLQDTLRNATPTSRVALTRRIHDILDDFRELHHSLSFRPTRIQELVALPPTVHGCHDAASPGAGGIVLPTASAAPRATKVKISPTARTRQQRNAAPIVWRFPFPKSVQRALVTVSPADITAALRTAVYALGPTTLGFKPSDITARCLRAAGAMALLCARVDTDIIRLLGRWRSDEMLRYLHLSAQPIMRDFSRQMLQGGAFVLNPMAETPQHG